MHHAIFFTPFSSKEDVNSLASLDYENGLYKQDRDAAGREAESGKWPHQARGCFPGAPVLRWTRFPGASSV